MDDALIQVCNLSKDYRKGKDVLRAVDQVSLTIARGETLGLVGESGCGKTTLGRSLLRLYEPTGGKISYDGETIFDGELKKQPDMGPYRSKMQMIFQDPGACLDPRKTVGENIGQAIDIHRLAQNPAERAERIDGLLERLGLRPAHKSAYPHAFSGGQQQRVVIARALAVNPQFLVCDEPVSALDLSVQAQIIQVLQELQRDMGLTYLFIGHDISIVQHISDRICVMYLGRLVEVAESQTLIQTPQHPYTKMLLNSVPLPQAGRRQSMLMEGELPSPSAPPSGCRFRSRCPHATKRCAEEEPELRAIAPGHVAACHLL